MTDSALLADFIQAANYTVDGNGTITRIVIHDEEYPEKVNAAREVAQFFAHQAHGNNGSSAHVCVDDKEAIGCVHEKDRAWHAPPNAGSLGLEHSGYSHQTAADWADPYSESMLHVSAKVVADMCKRHTLPVIWLSVEDLIAGKKGITSHNNVSLAWRQSSHTDPGPNFPVQHYLDLVNAAMSGTPSITTKEPEMFSQVVPGDGETHAVPLPNPKGSPLYSEAYWSLCADSPSAISVRIAIYNDVTKSWRAIKTVQVSNVGRAGEACQAGDSVLSLSHSGKVQVTAFIEAKAS